MKKIRFIAATLAMLAVMMAVPTTQVMAACAGQGGEKSHYGYETNRLSCDAGCGFLNFYRQDCWDMVTVYTCQNGANEFVVQSRMVGGNCC